jgi:hypothetical protein
MVVVGMAEDDCIDLGSVEGKRAVAEANVIPGTARGPTIEQELPAADRD